MKNRQIYTAKQLANSVGVCYMTVMRWIKSGKLVPDYIKRFEKLNRYYFDQESIDEIINNK